MNIDYTETMFEWLKRKVVYNPEKNLKSITLSSTPKEKARKAYANYYVGQVIHYYTQIRVGIIRIEKGTLCVGDVIYVQGATTRFKQKVASIEYNHQRVKQVGPGYEIGVRLGAPVREGDDVYVLPLAQS